ERLDLRPADRMDRLRARRQLAADHPEVAALEDRAPVASWKAILEECDRMVLRLPPHRLDGRDAELHGRRRRPMRPQAARDVAAVDVDLEWLAGVSHRAAA